MHTWFFFFRDQVMDHLPPGDDVYGLETVEKALRSAFECADKYVVTQTPYGNEGSCAVSVTIHCDRNGKVSIISCNLGDSRFVSSFTALLELLLFCVHGGARPGFQKMGCLLPGKYTAAAAAAPAVCRGACAYVARYTGRLPQRYSASATKKYQKPKLSEGQREEKRSCCDLFSCNVSRGREGKSGALLVWHVSERPERQREREGKRSCCCCC